MERIVLEIVYYHQHLVSQINTNRINTNFSALWFGFSVCRTKQSELSPETTSDIPELQTIDINAAVSDIVLNLTFSSSL